MAAIKEKILDSFPESFWNNKEVWVLKYVMKFLPYIWAMALGLKILGNKNGM